MKMFCHLISATDITKKLSSCILLKDNQVSRFVASGLVPEHEGARPGATPEDRRVQATHHLLTLTLGHIQVQVMTCQVTPTPSLPTICIHID